MNPLGVVEDSGLDPVSVTGVPDYPMTSNATLVVNEDDTLDLTIPIANPVFTIQGIGSGDGVSVASVTTRPGSYGPSGANLLELTTRVALAPLRSKSPRIAASPMTAATVI